MPGGSEGDEADPGTEMKAADNAVRTGMLTPFTVEKSRAIRLEWHKLFFEVPSQKGRCGGAGPGKVIVNGASGCVSPGTLTALMGPSGAGKSTMMNVLAGRAPYGKITSGKVVLNGKEANPQVYQRQLAYVMQHDAMFATQTPRELLVFTAALRLPELTASQRHGRVEAALQALRLERCADTMIGSVMIPGLSGGEKKRAAVAVELISSPSLIFLDEPTSGLDSHSAYELVMILKSLAESGCTIVCTIHQPSSEVFALFHNVVFLRRGCIVYDGPVDGIIPHFEKSGEVPPANTNPADFAMYCLQMLEDGQVQVLIDACQKRKEPSSNGQLVAADLPKLKTASPFVQLALLAQREFRQLIRDKMTLTARYGMGFALSVIVSLIFFGVGGEWGTDGDPADIQKQLSNHWGALVFTCINAMFLSAQPMVLAFPLERASFIREYTAGTYGAPVYLVAKTAVEIPATLLQQIIFALTYYWSLGLNGSFPLLVIFQTLLALVSSSTALTIGAATSNAETAVNALPGVYVPQILLSGFFISSDQVPQWLRWSQWVCPLKYGVGLATVTEFAVDAVPDNRESDVLALITRTQLNRDADMQLVYVSIMVGMFLGFRLLSCLLLSWRAKKFN